MIDSCHCIFIIIVIAVVSAKLQTVAMVAYITSTNCDGIASRAWFPVNYCFLDDFGNGMQHNLITYNGSTVIIKHCSINDKTCAADCNDAQTDYYKVGECLNQQDTGASVMVFPPGEAKTTILMEDYSHVDDPTCSGIPGHDFFFPDNQCSSSSVGGMQFNCSSDGKTITYKVCADTNCSSLCESADFGFGDCMEGGGYRFDLFCL